SAHPRSSACSHAMARRTMTVCCASPPSSYRPRPTASSIRPSTKSPPPPTAARLPSLVVALWAASSGFSAIQDAMNAAYKIKESRPYWKARVAAFFIGTLLSLLLTALLAILLATDFFGRVIWLHFWHHTIA